MSGMTWEYRIVPIVSGDEVTLKVLNALGADGWDLVAVDAYNRAILKRQGPDFRDRITQAQREALDRVPEERRGEA